MLSRRSLLASSAAGIMLSGVGGAQSRSRRRVLRVAHLTDTHVQPERGALDGFIACLAHVHAQRERPDLILTGGDLIMDAFSQSRERTQIQWDLFTKALRDHCTIPVQHTIGNHDVWGWGKGEAFSSDPSFGKKWACDLLGMEKPYRSFDRGGWHFIVLDGTFRHGNGYKARLDDEQFEWLKGDLAATPSKTPVLIVSHMPILGVGPYFDGENEKSGNWVVPGAWMHLDARKLKDLFLKHGNVKLCVSGHIHLVDEVVYNGVTYFCNGAVSAGWWGGNYQECTYGYGLVDLYSDGSFENRYVTFPWETRKS